MKKQVLSLAIMLLLNDQGAQAVALRKKSAAQGIFSSMIEAENAEENAKKEKEEAKARRKKQFEEAEAEHQALVEKEEAEERAEKQKEEEEAQKAQDEANYQAALKKRQQLLQDAASDEQTAQLSSQMNIEAL